MCSNSRSTSSSSFSGSENLNSSSAEASTDEGGEEEEEFEELEDDLPMQIIPGLYIGSMMAEMNQEGLRDEK